MRWYGRLRRSSEIGYVRRSGRTARGARLVGYAVPARDGRTAVAISVSKAVGTAVTRNLVRRRIRGALDGLPPLRTGVRLLVIVKPAAALAPYADLAADVAAMLGRTGAA